MESSKTKTNVHRLPKCWQLIIHINRHNGLFPVYEIHDTDVFKNESVIYAEINVNLNPHKIGPNVACILHKLKYLKHVFTNKKQRYQVMDNQNGCCWKNISIPMWKRESITRLAIYIPTC